VNVKLLVEYYEVLTANDGPSVLVIAKDHIPDIILLDVMMPGMDGYEFGRGLNSNPVTAHTPVVIVAALNEVKDRVRGLEVGADYFLTKLVNDVASFARIRSLVRLKRANEGDYDLVLVSDGNWSQDALRLCSQLRSGPETQRRPILIMVPDSEDDRLAKALELGVNNYLVRPIERDELISRSRT
jgi:two-component system cell cycle response regulator